MPEIGAAHEKHFLRRQAAKDYLPCKGDVDVLLSSPVAGVVARRFFRRPIITATRNAHKAFS
jgi:hypothetical protein